MCSHTLAVQAASPFYIQVYCPTYDGSPLILPPTCLAFGNLRPHAFPGFIWDETRRVCTQLDIRCTDAGEMVAKARDLVAAYTEVSRNYQYLFFLHVWCMTQVLLCSNSRRLFFTTLYTATKSCMFIRTCLCQRREGSSNQKRSIGCSVFETKPEIFHPLSTTVPPSSLSCSALHIQPSRPFSNTCLSSAL